MTQRFQGTVEDIAAAGKLLAAGGLVAFPTETVYGLGGDATNDQAVAKIFAAKGRPQFNPLISHLDSVEAARALGRFNDVAEALAAQFWPGALTLVVPRLPSCPISDLACAGLDTVALRVPAHDLARVLIQAAGRPIAAPSANRSGHVSPTEAAHVLADLSDRIDGVLDGGACAVGLESTVIDATGARPVLLRPGGIAVEEIEAAVGPIEVAGDDETAPRSPGMLLRHYAPERPLRLNALAPQPGEAFIGFGAHGAKNQETASLSPSGDLTEAAANLFRSLRAFDSGDWTGIAVMPIPDRGLGRAINDRLRRAANRDAPLR
ncbi:MAG: L-threonylcarbamoyladenylate synthase [Magnetospiraceae bacterium]